MKSNIWEYYSHLPFHHFRKKCLNRQEFIQALNLEFQGVVLGFCVASFRFGPILNICQICYLTRPRKREKVIPLWSVCLYHATHRREGLQHSLQNMQPLLLSSTQASLTHRLWYKVSVYIYEICLRRMTRVVSILVPFFQFFGFCAHLLRSKLGYYFTFAYVLPDKTWTLDSGEPD